jgi:hypothetical protein
MIMWAGSLNTHTVYEIRVEGLLNDSWSDWLGGLSISSGDGRETLIAGAVPDQVALFGILAQLHALNVTLISVQRIPWIERSAAETCLQSLAPDRFGLPSVP